MTLARVIYWLLLILKSPFRCLLVGTTTTEITNRKFVSADGLRCKYLVRKVVRTLTKPVLEPPKPAPTKSKRGRTLRPKIVLQPDDDDDAKRSPSEPIVLEAWYPEVRNDARYFYVDCTMFFFSVILGNIIGMKEMFAKCCFRDEFKK